MHCYGKFIIAIGTCADKCAKQYMRFVLSYHADKLTSRFSGVDKISYILISILLNLLVGLPLKSLITETRLQSLIVHTVYCIHIDIYIPAPITCAWAYVHVHVLERKVNTFDLCIYSRDRRGACIVTEGCKGNRSNNFVASIQICLYIYIYTSSSTLFLASSYIPGAIMHEKLYMYSMRTTKQQSRTWTLSKRYVKS